MVASRPRVVGSPDDERHEAVAPARDASTRATDRVPSLWSDHDYVRFFGLLVAAYVALYGTFLVRTDFLPYVFDNNESFATLWHARNLYEYGFAKSYGLTDEVFSPHEAAHPFVHTHQGNIPRVYAFFLYVLGARTIESQIAITTFTVGLAAVWLAYHLFSRLTAPLFGFVACLFLLTDYMHIAQWQVVTYRVWHLFFVFSSLVCVYQFGRGRWKVWAPLMFVNYACLYYYEYVFVAFVSIFGALLTFVLYWRRPRVVLAVGTIQVLGAATAMAVLLIQLTGYLGWDGVLTDMYLTYFARNYAGGDPTLAQRVTDFYADNNVIFWQNFIDSKQFRTVSRFFELLFAHVFGEYTPLLTLVSLTVVGGFLIGSLGVPSRLWSRLSSRLPSRLAWSAPDRAAASDGSARSPSGHSKARAVVGVTLLTLPAVLLLAAIGRDGAYAGVPNASLEAALLAGAGANAEASILTLAADPGVLLMALVAGLVCLVLAWAVTGRWLYVGDVSLGRLAVAATFMLALGQMVRAQPVHYDQAYRAIWRGPFATIEPHWGERAWLILAVILAVVMILFGTRTILGRFSGQLHGFLPYLACGAIAYVMTYILAPGYIYSGYLVRFAPLVVFVAGLFYALAVAVVVAATIRAATAFLALSGAWASSQSMNGHAVGASLGDPRQAPHRPDGAWPRLAAGGAMLMTGGLLATTLAYWSSLNITYMTTFMPPTYLSFMRMLSEPPYRGASFVANNYTAHVSYFTNEWSYTDHALGRGQVRRADDGSYAARQDLDTYLWMADKRENPAYRWPRYYLCLRNPGLEVALARVTGNRLFEYGCDAIPLVKRATDGTSEVLQHRLVAADSSPWKYWAIVELDWDYPPYLRPLPGADRDSRYVRLTAEPAPNGTLLRVEYDYEQQAGRSEEGTRIQLLGLGQGDVSCAQRDLAPGETVLLPPGSSGTFRASVLPRSATREGREAYSNTVTIGAPGGDCPVLP